MHFVYREYLADITLLKASARLPLLSHIRQAEGHQNLGWSLTDLLLC